MQIPEYILALFELKAECLNKLAKIDEKIDAWINAQANKNNEENK